jgi:hypothetical protein
VGDPVLAIVGGLFAVIGVALAALACWVFRAESRVMRGVEVTAQVVGSVEEYSEEDPIFGTGGTRYVPQVRFRTPDGEVTAKSSRVLSGNPRRVPRVGATVRLRYDPAAPTSVYIHGWDAPARTLPYVLLGAGLLTFAVGVGLFAVF